MGKHRDQEYLFGNVLGFLFQNFVLMERKSVLSNLSVIAKKYRTGISATEALDAVGLGV